MNKCCGACRYCDRSTFDLGIEVEAMDTFIHPVPCRRHPPVMGLDGNNYMEPAFPTVDPLKDWCGEYESYDDGFWTLCTYDGSLPGLSVGSTAMISC